MTTAVLIEEIIANSNEYAAGILEDARAMVEDAVRTAEGRVYLSPREWSFEVSEQDLSFLDEAAPSFTETYTDPGENIIVEATCQVPQIPSPMSVPDAPDALDTSAMFGVDRPEWVIPEFTASEPTISTELTIPELPTIVYPDLPDPLGELLTVPDIAVPSFGDIFRGQLPDTISLADGYIDNYKGETPRLIGASESFAETMLARLCPDYDTSMESLELAIKTGITGAGAISAGWLETMNSRAVTRTQNEVEASRRSITDGYARRGFAIPPGAVMGGALRAQFEGNHNLATLRAEIINDRTRMEVQHLQFCLQLSASIRQAMIASTQSFMQILLSANGQAIQYAGDVARWSYEVFSQRAQIFNLELERYRAEAGVFSVRMESAFAELKKFDAEIAAEKLKIDVDNAAIARYEAQINAERNKIAIYTAQFEGITAQVQVQAQQVSMYEAQVRAYASRVGAKTSEYEAYKAALAGDSERVNAYAVEVQAYAQQVNAGAAVVESERNIAQVVTEHNKILLERQDSSIRRYLAMVQSESQRLGNSVEAYKAALASYMADLDARVKLVTTAYEKDRLILQGKIAEYEGSIRTMISAGELSQKSIATQADIVSSGAQILGHMGASALTANNAIVSQTGEG